MNLYVSRFFYICVHDCSMDPVYRVHQALLSVILLICETQSMLVIDTNAVHVRPLDPVQALDPKFVHTPKANVRQPHVQTRPADNIELALVLNLLVVLVRIHIPFFFRRHPHF
jgi:hypothetical protein